MDVDRPIFSHISGVIVTEDIITKLIENKRYDIFEILP